MAIRVTEAKKGMVIRYDGDLYQITKYDHVTPGNWRAIHHLNLKNLKNGRQKDVRMNTSDQIEPVFLDSRESQYLFKDSLGYTFMDNENYEQFVLNEEVVGDAMQYITENADVVVVFCEGEALTVQLPAAVVLEVIETEPSARGDTVSNVQKPAKLNTGLEIKVPAHIKTGEKVKVNTETGEFLGRAS
ncbi:MAG: elongation factor P [Planctomycetota bacterium]|nr:elongation factor P [Planctomycetota bacterium]